MLDENMEKLNDYTEEDRKSSNEEKHQENTDKKPKHVTSLATAANVSYNTFNL